VMLVSRLIEVLQEQIERGYLKLDDDLVVDWFSYDDVHRVASNDEAKITDDEARTIWAECVEEIDNFDSYDVEVINNCISNTVSLHMEQKGAK